MFKSKSEKVEKYLVGCMRLEKGEYVFSIYNTMIHSVMDKKNVSSF